MDTFGRHILYELWDCNRLRLNDINFIEHLFVDAALKSGAEIREVTFHRFAPLGVSGVIIISESHLSIHSFPEQGYASVDIYTCSQKMDPTIAGDIIITGLMAKHVETMEISRGTKGKILRNV